MALDKREDVDLLIYQLENYDPEWTSQDYVTLFGSDATRLAGIERIKDTDEIKGKADLTIRVTISFNPPVFPSSYLLILATSEHGYLSSHAISGSTSLKSTNWDNKIIITPSDWAAKGILASGGKEGDIFIVPHGVSSEFIALSKIEREDLRKKKGWDNSYVFLHVSSLTANKNPEMLIRVFARVIERFSNVKVRKRLWSSSNQRSLDLSSVKSVLTPK